MNEVPSTNYIELAADIVSAYVSKNSVTVGDLPNLINDVHAALMRVSNGAAEDHPVSAGIKGMSECLADKSDGKMKLRGFYNGELGDDAEATQSVRSGSIEMVVTGAAAIGGIEPATVVGDRQPLAAAPHDACCAAGMLGRVAQQIAQNGQQRVPIADNDCADRHVVDQPQHICSIILREAAPCIVDQRVQVDAFRCSALLQ